MTLLEMADLLDKHDGLNPDVPDRLRELHDHTPWIAVSERLPTKEDGDSRFYMVQVVSTAGFFASVVYTAVHYSLHSHWKRITSPEDKP
jgi:hypothetical protein